MKRKNFLNNKQTKRIDTLYRLGLKWGFDGDKAASNPGYRHPNLPKHALRLMEVIYNNKGNLL